MPKKSTNGTNGSHALDLASRLALLKSGELKGAELRSFTSDLKKLDKLLGIVDLKDVVDLAEKAKKKEEGAIEIPPIRMGTIELTIEGVSPLIINALSHGVAESLEEGQFSKKAKGPKAARDRKKEFNAARYLNEGGKDCVRGDSLKHALAGAALLVDGVSRTLAQKILYVKDDMIPIKFKGKLPRMRRDFVRVGGKAGKGSGTLMTRYRPEYNPWSCTFLVDYDTDLLSAEQIINLANRAGYQGGIGEWRPSQSGGNFGRFRVVRGR